MTGIQRIEASGCLGPLPIAPRSLAIGVHEVFVQQSGIENGSPVRKQVGLQCPIAGTNATIRFAQLGATTIVRDTTVVEYPEISTDVFRTGVVRCDPKIKQLLRYSKRPITRMRVKNPSTVEECGPAAGRFIISRIEISVILGWLGIGGERFCIKREGFCGAKLELRRGCIRDKPPPRPAEALSCCCFNIELISKSTAIRLAP